MKDCCKEVVGCLIDQVMIILKSNNHIGEIGIEDAIIELKELAKNKQSDTLSEK